MNAAAAHAAASVDASSVLRLLVSSRAVLDARQIAVVVAHPDDEAIGLGGQFARLPQILVIHLTDGAPLRWGYGAGWFPDRAAYASARAAELAEALKAGEAIPQAVLSLGMIDQEAHHDIAAAAERLADIFAEHGTRMVFTHAYEGGHPDHDSAAYAVFAVARLLQRRGIALETVEMPFYRLGEDGNELRQSFAGEGFPEFVAPLSPDQQRRKAAMLDAHRSQSQVLAGFSCLEERFRPAPSYDFRKPPNGGWVLYARKDWGIPIDDWLAAAERASRALGLQP